MFWKFWIRFKKKNKKSAVSEKIIIGRITDTFGIKGEMRFVSQNCLSVFYLRLQKAYIDPVYDYYVKIESMKPYKEGWIIKVKNIDSIEQAEWWKSAFFYYPCRSGMLRKDKPVFEPVKYAGRIGKSRKCTIKDYWENNDQGFFLIVRDSMEYIIPNNSHFVKKIDQKRKRIAFQKLKEIEGSKVEI